MLLINNFPTHVGGVFAYSDWFKAGKGPDPKKASLDRDMDDYFEKQAAAKAAAADAAAEAPAEAPPAAAAE